MTTSKKETVLDWLANFIGLAGGIPAIVERLGKFWGAVPVSVQEQVTQKLPGIMGIGTTDETIFNSLLPKLDLKERKTIVDFIFSKFQPFQRNRFILVVASMEVTKGTPETVEKKWSDKAKDFEEKTVLGKNSEDLRLNFLKGLSAYIDTYGQDEAYKLCIASRIILETSVLQNVKHSLGAAGEGVAEQASKASKSINETSTFQNIFGVGGKEVAKQALKDAIKKRRGR